MSSNNNQHINNNTLLTIKIDGQLVTLRPSDCLSTLQPQSTKTHSTFSFVHSNTHHPSVNSKNKNIQINIRMFNAMAAGAAYHGRSYWYSWFHCVPLSFILLRYVFSFFFCCFIFFFRSKTIDNYSFL